MTTVCFCSSEINYLGGRNEKSFIWLPWHNIMDYHQAFFALGIPQISGIVSYFQQKCSFGAYF